MCGLAYCRLRLGGLRPEVEDQGDQRRYVAGKSHERAKVRCPEIVVFRLL